MAIVVLFMVPILAGLLGTALPSFGYWPGDSTRALHVQPWRDLADAPGLGQAIFTSVFSGVGATVLSLVIAVSFTASWSNSKISLLVSRSTAPLLAVPHAAFAIGFAFLFIPSGWLIRIITPWLSGWSAPPDYLFIQDLHGVGLMVALVCKELFFLLLVMQAALSQIDAQKYLSVTRTLGSWPVCAWLKVIFPMIYPQIRLPLYAVLAYSLSVVDMSMIVGPATPPSLSVLAVNWMQDPDIGTRLQGAAAALLLFGIVVIAVLGWRGLEKIVIACGRAWIFNGPRTFAEKFTHWISGIATSLILVVSGFALISLVLWSFADVWRFPAALPSEFTLRTWIGAWDGLKVHSISTFILAIVSGAVALLLGLGILENEYWKGARPKVAGQFFLYMPLMIPQVSFLFGLQVALVYLNIDGSWLAVVWSHLVFVVPYVFLIFADPFRNLDPRFTKTALSLGKPPFTVLRTVKIPLLKAPMAIAFAVGFSVSVSQYLATLFPGVGKIQTLTTEAVTLAAGGDRRDLGAYGLAQFMLPLIVFSIAAAVAARHTRTL